LIVKKIRQLLIVIQLSDFKTRDDKKIGVISEAGIHCIFILWANTQNLTG